VSAFSPSGRFEPLATMYSKLILGTKYPQKALRKSVSSQHRNMVGTAVTSRSLHS
jgi:hypothetical protein